MTSPTGKLIIVTHILSNTLGTKGNHTLKLGYLIKNNMRNIFNETSYMNFCGETSSGP